MFPIFKKEVNSFLNSLVGYIVIGVFLVATSLFLWVFKGNVLDSGFAEMGTFFEMTPWIFMVIIPAITMRSFAEELRTGTIEFLFTKPLSHWQIILGKYLAACFLVFLALLPTLIYYYSVYQLGNPQGNLDSAGIFGSYIGLLLLGCVFAAVGTFTSALTDNQVVAFVVGVTLCFVLYSGISAVADLDLWGGFQYTFQQMGLNSQYNALGRGLVDSRNLIYFFSLIFLALYATKLRLEKTI
jgi:ABC-2 type transport system permease protein